MSQTVITQAFETLKAQEAANGGVVTLDEFVFASVPDLNITDPIDRNEGLPPAAQIVHRQAVSKTGMVNSNAVVYSVVLGADVGDFEFNWVGLLNKASGVVAMIVHAPSQKKIRTQSGQQGNVLTRSFLMEYNGASQQTQIITPADTWQIDFTARLNGVDERVRLENIDTYGAAAFLGDGFKVIQNGSKYVVKQGVAYIAGLRAELLFDQDMTVSVRPSKIWADVCWQGTMTSVWATQAKLTVADTLADYTDNDTRHYVFAIAEILSDGSVKDLRPVSVVHAVSALVPRENSVPYFDNEKAVRLAALSDFVRLMLDKGDSAEVLEYLGLNAHGGSLIGVQQPFPDSVLQTLQEVNAEKVYVRNFGAKGNYVPGVGGDDDTAAFRKAVAYCGGDARRKLCLGRGSYLITDTIFCKPLTIEGEGGNSRIFARNMGGKPVFDMTTPSTDVGRVIGSLGVEWVADGADIDCAILGPKDDTQYFTYFLRYVIRDNYCRGANRSAIAYSFAWDYGAKRWFRIGDCVGAQISNNCIQGKFDIQQDFDAQPGDAGFEFDAAGAVLSARVHDNNIGPIKTAIKILNNTFASIHDNDLIGTMDGIDWAGEIPFNEPKVHHNNINSQKHGVVYKGASSLSFTDNTIRRHARGWKGTPYDWYGFRISNSFDTKLLGNTVQPDSSLGAFPNVNYGYALTTCSLSTLTGNNVGVGCNQGISLVDCTGINISDTVSTQNASTDILFRMTKNARYINIGLYSVVSSFTGTVLSKDSTIVSPVNMFNSQFDQQSTGNVISEKTRVTAPVDSKKWRETVGNTQLSRAIVSDSGVAINYEVITRNAATGISQYEIRADRVRLNNGPEVITGTGSPEGVVAATKASQFWRTDSASSASLYIKETGVGNTGWVAK